MAPPPKKAVAPGAPPAAPSSFVGSLLGMKHGRFFGVVDDYVNLAKAPGMSALPANTFLDWLLGTPLVLITSPNAVWALIALAAYYYFPYDLSPTGLAAQAPFSRAFFELRFPLWAGMTLAYVAFWHVSLYVWGWAHRSFIKDRPYNLDKLAHNVFWSVSGIAIWTCFDNLFAFLWATGRLPYVSDADSFSTPLGAARFVAALMGVPVWRSVHFYFAHKLLHFRPLYLQVHSLHHRNTDIEPFAGLCMHPVEHLYYYACVLPSLVFLCSPFAFFWNGVHLLLSPAASHSGWEDHFQADAFHYMHHRYFECNYAGSDAKFIDIFFGTFVESMAAKDKDGVKLRADAKSTLRAVPTLEFTVYLLVACACVGVWAQAALAGAVLVPATALILAAVAGFGPVVASSAVSLVMGGVGGTPMFSGLSSVVQLLIGTCFCSVPITWMCWLALTKAA